MLKRASELRWEHSPNHKGGKGTCHILNVLEPEEMHGTGRCYAVSVLPAGASIGKHFHTGDFETYYILKGRARYNDNGAIVEIGPGDMVHCPDGGFHAIENVGEGEMTLLLYRQRYKPLKGVAAPAAPIFGSAWDLPVENLFGMENVQRVLTLPDELSMDLAVNLMSFQPGGCHTYAETHADEHAMYVLEGEGAYWLGDNWSITKKDDFVWMGPFCPQAAYGVGRHRYTYLLTKDVNRDVEL